MRLIDTAGFNLAPSPLEKRGIEKTIEQAAEADLFLWVIDSSRPLPVLPPTAANHLTSANTIAVYNKADLNSGMPFPAPMRFQTVQVSSLTGAGFDELQNLIVKLADSFRIEAGEELIAINARHAVALEQATECLCAAKDKLRSQVHTELISSDLRGALDSFGEISGRVDNERILDRLFSSFCIGK